jgi:hypothetical protein
MKLIIINDVSEYNAFVEVQNLGVLSRDIKVIVRLNSAELKFIDQGSNQNILWLSATDHKWFSFLRSAIGDLKANKHFLGEAEIELYLFTRYDPIIHYLVFFFKIKSIISLNQHPFYEVNNKRMTFQKNIKSLIKSLSLLFHTKKYSKIRYRSGQHEIYPTKYIPTQHINLFPKQETKKLFDFGKFLSISDETIGEKVFFTNNLYLLDNVKKIDFIVENINFINSYGIKKVCFHPRHSEEFRASLKMALPNVSFYEGVRNFPEQSEYVPVSICSTVCFSSVLRGKNAVLVPDHFQSVMHIHPIPALLKYLNELKEKIVI